MVRSKKDGDGLAYEVRAPRQARFAVEQGPRVEVGYGLVAHEWIDFTAQVNRVKPIIDGHLILDDPPSRYLLDRFCLHRGDTSSLGTGTMRSVPVDYVVSVVCRNFGLAGPEYKDGVLSEGFVVDLWEVESATQLRKRGLNDEEALQYVAKTYLTYSLLAAPPVEWVAQMLDCSMPTATRWVAAAKDAGFLQVASRQRR